MLSIDERIALTRKLMNRADFTRFDIHGESEAERYANALCDIVEAAAAIEAHARALLTAAGPDADDDALTELRISIQHVAWHIYDSKIMRQTLRDVMDTYEEP